MIRVDVQRTGEKGWISSFRVNGHAGFAEAGNDIVCAGVSAITVGTVNAVESLLGVKLPAEMRKGLLAVSIPELPDEPVREQVQLLLESMLVMLDTIQQSYGAYIKIHDRLQ